MDQEQLDTLTNEAREIEYKKRANRRIFIAFLILDIALAIYAIYAFIFFLSHLN